MTTIERPHRSPDGSKAVDGPRSIGSAVSVVCTTELRWFGHGPVPPDVAAWFHRGQTPAAVEERSDTYRLDGRTDIGVKRRFRETLELKVRRGLEECLSLGAGLQGPLEVWRKWSPADGLVDLDEHHSWVDVHKTVSKRRFTAEGDESAIVDGAAPPAESWCDVEVTAVSIDGVSAWSLAFAAYGPPARRRETIATCWRGLIADAPLPENLSARLGGASGYPEWMNQFCQGAP